MLTLVSQISKEARKPCCKTNNAQIQILCLGSSWSRVGITLYTQMLLANADENA